MRRKENVPIFDDRRRQPAARASSRSRNTTPLSQPSVEGRGARSSASPSPVTSPYRRDTSSHVYRLPRAEKPRTPSSSSDSRGWSLLSSESNSNSWSSSVAYSRSSGLPSPKSNPSTTLGANPREAPRVDIESDFIDTKPLARVLELVESRDYCLVSGLIERSNGSWQPATGVLEPKQTFNFMTEHRANDLGLLGSAEQYTGEDGDVWIKAPSGGKVNPIGTLQVRWRATQSRPITLLFWVFPNDRTRSLVLGAPFENKMNYQKGVATR